MATELKNKRITLTTKYTDAVCTVTAYGFRKKYSEPWTFYLKEKAVKAAEKRISGDNNCLMLTPEAAAIVGDEIDVVADGHYPLYATIRVKR